MVEGCKEKQSTERMAENCKALLDPHNNSLSFCFTCSQNSIFLIRTYTLFCHLLQINRLLLSSHYAEETKFFQQQKFPLH